MTEIRDINPIERRLPLIKQLFSMLLTSDGRLLIKNNTRFRNVVMGKIYEFEAHPMVCNDIQFLGISGHLMTVIEEEQRLLNL